MCALSGVFDQWGPYIPYAPPVTVPNTMPGFPYTVPTPPQPVAPPYTDEELRELVDAFTKATEAAKTLDRLTGQPDCEDLDKAELLGRVEELERRLNALEDEVDQVADDVEQAVVDKVAEQLADVDRQRVLRMARR